MNYRQVLEMRKAALLHCRLSIIQINKGKVEASLASLGKARALRRRIAARQDQWAGQAGEV